MKTYLALSFILPFLSYSIAYSQVSVAPAPDIANQLNFSPVDNGLVLSPIDFTYDLEADPKVLKFGSYSIDTSTIIVNYGLAEKIDKETAGANDLTGKMVMAFRWPEELIPFATIEAINRKGDMLWSKQIDFDQMEKFRDQKVSFETNIGKRKAKAKYNFLKFSYALIDIDQEEILPFKEAGVFKFCFKYVYNEYFTRICTQNYEFKFKGEVVSVLKTVDTKQSPRVLIRNESASAKGEVVIKPNESFRFFAELANGYSLEFFSEPQNTQLIDIVAAKGDPQSFVLRGHSVIPMFAKVLNPIKRKGFLYAIDWLPTIGDLKPYWELTLPMQNAEILLTGIGGGIYRQKVEVKKVPSEELRPRLTGKRYYTTYSDSPIFKGKVKPGGKLTSVQKQVGVAKNGNFIWTMDAPLNNQENTSSLQVENGEDKWVTSAKIYRGYANELSGRFSGVLSTTGETVALGEIAYNHWFENIFGWDQYYASSRRWGVSIKTFKSLADFKDSQDNEEKLSFSSTTAELKYRLTPGIWGRDESWGLLLGYQDVSLYDVGGPMYGGGFFWARSMPKLFDDLVNYLPFMEYPKWVDLEFIYYPATSKADLELGSNYSMNFHGKVLWSDRIFGEAGFGVKFYDVIDDVAQRQAILQSFYGTVGLGISF